LIIDEFDHSAIYVEIEEEEECNKDHEIEELPKNNERRKSSTSKTRVA